MTGIPASTIVRARESDGPAPSSLTASASASLTKRIAFSSADSSETWNEPNGMSATTSGRGGPAGAGRGPPRQTTTRGGGGEGGGGVGPRDVVGRHALGGPRHGKAPRAAPRGQRPTARECKLPLRR